MVLLKLPVPLPIVTLLFDIVGLAVVAHTMPLSVTVAPPSAVTLPPNIADDDATALAAAVVTVGATLAPDIVNVFVMPALVIGFASSNDQLLLLLMAASSWAFVPV